MPLYPASPAWFLLWRFLSSLEKFCFALPSIPGEWLQSLSDCLMLRGSALCWICIFMRIVFLSLTSGSRLGCWEFESRTPWDLKKLSGITIIRRSGFVFTEGSWSAFEWFYDKMYVVLSRTGQFWDFRLIGISYCSGKKLHFNCLLHFSYLRLSFNFYTFL